MAKAKRRGPTANQRSRRVASAEKAAYHNLGAGKLPMRAFVGNTDREIDELVKLMQAKIDSRVR